jgi:hypothetical protein
MTGMGYSLLYGLAYLLSAVALVLILVGVGMASFRRGAWRRWGIFFLACGLLFAAFMAILKWQYDQGGLDPDESGAGAFNNPT